MKNPLSVNGLAVVTALIGIAGGCQLFAAEELSLNEAIRLALAERKNTAAQLTDERVKEVESQVELARSALLPHLSGEVTQRRQTVNLEAFGIRSSVGLFQLPQLAGPFSVFDARGRLQQKILDFSALRGYQASKAALEASKAARGRNEEEITLHVAQAYLKVQREEATWQAARAQVELGKELLELAKNQKEAGTGTGIEITRARVQLAEAEQGLIDSQNQLDDARLELLKVIGLDLGIDVHLTEKLDFKKSEIEGDDKAIDVALDHREDLKAQIERERSSELTYRSARSERLPVLSGFADYGTIGSSPDEAIPTWSVGVSLEIPLFDGGVKYARRHQAQTQMRREKIRTHDLRKQIELEVRKSINHLESSRNRVDVAEEALMLVEAELEQARRRYRAGVTTSLEVTDAQSRLERAQKNRIDSLYAYSLARLQLLTAMGILDANNL